MAESLKTQTSSKKAKPVSLVDEEKLSKRASAPKATTGQDKKGGKCMEAAQPETEKAVTKPKRSGASKVVAAVAEKTAPVVKPKAAPARSTRKKIEKVISTEAIAWRAYEIWQARGGVHGSDRDDWYQAEQELMAECQGTNS